MKVHTVGGALLPFDGTGQGLRQFAADVEGLCGQDGVPLRVIVTRTSGNGWDCEIECIQKDGRNPLPAISSIFSFRQRRLERTSAFIAAMLVPTGIDCAVGGHAGDATPAARLLASVCDQLIVHPNVVNASDVNEQTDNSLYVEGSLVCRLLMGTISLRKVRSNRILMVTEKRDDGQWAVDQIVNTTSAARGALGVDCPKVVVLERGLSMKMGYSQSGRAVGEISNLEGLFDVLRVERANYDAVALASKLTALTGTDELYQNYFGGEGPNPWGGAEAALTHVISAVFDVPSAHAPTLETLDLRTHSYGQVDPRKAAEAISTSFSFCLFKGLHRAPAVVADPDGAYDPSVIAAEDVSCLIVPDGCLGLPMLAAFLQGIPIIAVRGNKNMMKADLAHLPFRPGRLWVVENYLEAAGLISALKAGIHPSSVNRPLARTRVVSS